MFGHLRGPGSRNQSHGLLLALYRTRDRVRFFLRIGDQKLMVYPFAAILGQEQMKLALLLNAIDPLIGGVLIRGQKGTAKSTAVRGLAQLLPAQSVMQGCQCGCDPSQPENFCPNCLLQSESGCGLLVSQRSTPVIELPLNATEDMVLGSFDFEKALQNGTRVFQPGLLAKAHRGFLYVDEVNLLVDHLVDVIMDAAGSGINVVEREGVSFQHASRFALVGTMNPEEGELRPQLLDRFGLCVAVEGEQDIDTRVRLLTQREMFDAGHDAFAGSFEKESRVISQAIAAAGIALDQVGIDKHVRAFISNLCLENNVAGHRADLTLRRAARALAAYEGRNKVSEEDVARVAPMVFLHRRREVQSPPPPQTQSQAEQENPKENETSDPRETQPPPPQLEQNNDSKNQDPSDGLDSGEPNAAEMGTEQDAVFAIGDIFKVRSIQTDQDRKLRTGSGRRSISRTATRRGRYSRSAMSGSNNDLALDATLRAAAVHQVYRPERRGMALAIERADWRFKIRETRMSNFLLFVVDASGSMGAQARMVAVKGAVMSLLLDAYQKRDKIAMISFRGDKAELILPPTSSIETSARLLAELPVGGRTPLAEGIKTAHQELIRQLRREPECKPIALLVTDGKANSSPVESNPWTHALKCSALAAADQRIRWVVVDTESKSGMALGLARQLALSLNAEYFETEQLNARDLIDLTRS
jgi:magnesium chelatase subunit D